MEIADETEVDRRFIDLQIPSLIHIRGEKTSKTKNLFEDLPECGAAVQFVTRFGRVRRVIVEQCCKILAYALRLRCGLTTFDFSARNELTDNEKEQLDLLQEISSLGEFKEQFCAMVNRLLGINESIRKACNESKDEIEKSDSLTEEEKTEWFQQLEIMNEDGNMIESFTDVYRQANDVLQSISDSDLYNSFLISFSLSERKPFVVSRGNLTDLGTLFASLVLAIDASTDLCNTFLEALFLNGAFIMSLTMAAFDRYVDAEQCKAHTNLNMPWTRLRILREEDRPGIMMITNVNDPKYQKIITHLPRELFDPQQDVYISISDTVSTILVQQFGKLFLRTHEWIVRSDVYDYVKQHFVPDNPKALFANIGRGRMQQNWIRFFKRTRDGETRLYTQLEPLISLHDEIAATPNSKVNRANPIENEEEEEQPSSDATKSSESTEIRAFDSFISNKTAPVVKIHSTSTKQKYDALIDFQKKYNAFMANNRTNLYEHWQRTTSTFAANAGLYEKGYEIQLEPSCAANDFERWCGLINAHLFPLNILMISTNGTKDTIEKSFDDYWTMKAISFFIEKRATSGKIKPLLEFMKKMELRSRMVVDAPEFMGILIDLISSSPTLFQEMQFLLSTFKKYKRLPTAANNV